MRLRRVPLWPLRWAVPLVAIWLGQGSVGAWAAAPDETAARAARRWQGLLGETVVALAVRSDVPLPDAAEVTALVPIAVGEPLTREGVRRALRNVQASGLATEIEVRAERAPASDARGAGVLVTVVLWANVQVEAVGFRGSLGVEEDVLRAAITVQAGEPLLEGRVLRSVYRLQDLYRARGYFTAVVRVEVDTEAARKLATVTFAVESGPRATIGAITFVGALQPPGNAEMLAALESRQGEPYLASRVRDDSERLRVFLVRQGYRLARVESAREVVQGAVVELAYAVERGPLVEVRVQGGDLERLRKRGLLPFLADEGYDEALVLQAIDWIRRDLEEQGHARARVEKREERTAERWLVTLVVEPGPGFSLVDVSFAGNREVPASTLAGLMRTAPRRLLRPGSGRLVDQHLRDDLANLRSYYALEGYAKARIGPHRLVERGRELELVVPVFEGAKSVVDTLALEGLVHLDASWLLARLPLRAGGPFHPLLLDDAVNLVRSELLDRGFEQAQVVPSIAWNEERTRVGVVLTVYEGTQSLVDRVILRGNVRTRDDVVRRFVALRPGDVVARKDLLEVQRELYRLGIFSRVEVSLPRAGADAADRDVVVRLEEGRVRRLLYGVGYDSEDGASGLLGLSHHNLFGRALAAQLDVRASEREQQARVLFRQPFVGRFPVPVTYTLYRTDERQPAFESARQGAQVEAERRFGVDRRSRLGLLYTYKIVGLDLLDSDASIDRSLRDIRISSLTPSLLLDRRDDPINPTRGFSMALQFEVASPLLLADEAFLKLFVQGTHQVPWRRTVLATSVRLGAIEPASDEAPPDPSLPERLPAAEVPISERFFAGGRTSHRAYERDFLGLRGATLCARGDDCSSRGSQFLPVGGNGLGLLNVDLRFPIAGDFGGTVFVDAGNVWPRWQDLRIADFKLGAGIGARYLTPIGPLRAEIGWKLDRERGESPYEIFLSFGNPF
jgi:outer membrane protein insertion porin family